jgi:hypothetical protein
MMSTAASSGVGAANAKGLRRQHAALTSMTALVVAVRPSRSAIRPAATEPARPAKPIAANTIAPVSTREGASPNVVVRDAAKNAGSHAQKA